MASPYRSARIQTNNPFESLASCQTSGVGNTHRDLPDEIPADWLRVPHGTLIDRIEASAPCDVHCSDCHGGVGHGFDPVSGAKFCSMTVCVDCHQERSLEVQTSGCGGCHISPHDGIGALTCTDCHTSTQTWTQVSLSVHPVPLPGKHGEAACFDCHDPPNFAGLDNVCADCHVAGHSERGDDCSLCHDPGTTWDLKGSRS
jgi:hypothetical protein